MAKECQFLCPSCEREISAPPAAVGQKTRCCLCEAVIVVPTAEEARQFRDDVQHRKDMARLQKEAEEAEKYAQREHEKEARRRQREEEKETRRRQDELVAAQQKKLEEESAARAREYQAQTALVERAAQEDDAERKLIRSGELVSRWLYFCAVLCWIGSILFLAISLPKEGHGDVFLSFLIAGAVSALGGLLLAVFAGWVENYSRVIARISAAVRREARQEDRK
jgi:hypothetical protein